VFQSCARTVAIGVIALMGVNSAIARADFCRSLRSAFQSSPRFADLIEPSCRRDRSCCDALDSATKICRIWPRAPFQKIESAEGCFIAMTTLHGDSLQCGMYHDIDKGAVDRTIAELQQKITSCDHSLKFRSGPADPTDPTGQVLQIIGSSDRVVGRLYHTPQPVGGGQSVLWVYLEIFGHS
jgi:hypothetical protein